MSSLTDPIAGNPSDDQLPTGTAPDPGAGQVASDSSPGPGSAMSPLMIAAGLLTGHPANVRLDLDLGEEFCASVAEVGVRIPLQVTYGGGGEGRAHRGPLRRGSRQRR